VDCDRASSDKGSLKIPKLQVFLYPEIFFASGSMSERQSVWSTDDSSHLSSTPYAAFVSEILSRVSVHVGILVDGALEIPNKDRPSAKRSTSSRIIHAIRNNSHKLALGNRNEHILFLYFGGVNDRFALRLVLQLVQNPLMTATIVHIDVPASVPTTTMSQAACNVQSSSVTFEDASATDVNNR
jgi:hypothetical protein